MASWAVAWRRRHTARRGLLALAAPALAGVASVAFAALVDRP
ncbi:hypothetical protein [Streptomyces pratensis]